MNNVPGGRDLEVTKEVIRSVRTNLPGAEIILSTWKGENVEDFDVDLIILNDDPGGFFMSSHRNPKFLNEVNNVNRQIVSTKEGINAASKTFILKIRSDIMLNSARFLQYFDKFPAKGTDYCILNDRVITCSFFARNPRVHESPFHPSDWVSFGSRADMTTLWDIPLVEETEQMWFENRERPKTVQKYYRSLISRYNTEQYLWIGFLRKHGLHVSADHMFDVNSESIEETEMSFANNLIIISPAEFGIKLLKKVRRTWAPWQTYTHNDWQRLYSNYCDPKCQLPRVDLSRIMIYLGLYWR